MRYNQEQLFERNPMSLDFPRLLPQVHQLGEAAAQRATVVGQAMTALKTIVDQVSEIGPEEIKQRIKLAGEYWAGAWPSQEPINASYPPPALPDRYSVIGADGSQIYPNRHGSALYFLINVGGLRLNYGGQAASQTSTHANLYFKEDDLYQESGGLISNTIINGMRDVAEMEELVEMSKDTGEHPPVVLLDNGLLLWLAFQTHDEHDRRADELIQAYLHNLDQLKSGNTALAGFIDRPRSANVVALLHIASLPMEEINDQVQKNNPFRGITDRTLFSSRLKPGYRSACFIPHSKVNDRFAKAGQEIRFFYLNTGRSGQIARVEIPLWAAEQPEMLARIHSIILNQGINTGGFPYALIRAHELAVVSRTDQDMIENMVQKALLSRGLPAQASQKSRTKRWLSGKRRHQL
jgi:hypothetical protein